MIPKYSSTEKYNKNNLHYLVLSATNSKGDENIKVIALYHIKKGVFVPEQYKVYPWGHSPYDEIVKSFSTEECNYLEAVTSDDWVNLTYPKNNSFSPIELEIKIEHDLTKNKNRFDYESYRKASGTLDTFNKKSKGNKYFNREDTLSLGKFATDVFNTIKGKNTKKEAELILG